VPLPDDLANPDPDSLTLLLVRHGRTRFNAERRVQGWADSELTPDGLAGVRATAADLSRLTLDAAYSSPSQRTLTTSAEILEHHPAVELAPRDGLREFNFGVFEERSEAELVDHIDWMELFRSVLDGTYPGFPGGESARTYLDRVEAVFDEIETSHAPGENVLVVSHGMTLMVYLAMSGFATSQALANASVTAVRVDRFGVRRPVVIGHDPSGQAVQEGELAPAEAAAFEAQASEGHALRD
jgi:probable phosphoglycerate mutase